MRLPSSSSLLLASLAVSASSSSSLSALAAPAGDLPEDSSSPNPVAHCTDGAVTRSLGAPTGSASAFFSDTATDHPQSRGLVNDIENLLPALRPLLDPILKHLAVVDVAGLPRDSASATDGDSTSPESPMTTPPAPPSTPAVSHPKPPGPTS